MELTESDCKPPNRSILTIDLNETPSSSETLPSPSSAFPLSPTSMVRSFHDNHPPAEGPPADIPGEGWASSSCGACGRPEVRGHVVVCDGCERGFHFGCAGMRGRQAALLEEWVCGECLSGGVGSRRWPLGRKRGGGVRLLDMNLSPPSDDDGGEGAGDGEGSAELLMARDPRQNKGGGDSAADAEGGMMAEMVREVAEAEELGVADLMSLDPSEHPIAVQAEQLSELPGDADVGAGSSVPFIAAEHVHEEASAAPKSDPQESKAPGEHGLGHDPLVSKLQDLIREPPKSPRIEVSEDPPSVAGESSSKDDRVIAPMGRGEPLNLKGRPRRILAGPCWARLDTRESGSR
ncbi:hypothetical protein Nepgr_011130 [Nepenthes gracilis]|uniref:PHD-type domain-containing protein n=1 Tax=Nepenthes gracilis TaxID=150966 RepID=A0AAD3SEN4_NEPGR|nr:hypothetical protein Nepgr_011130 [Nepenthes gracilis]